MVEMKREKKFRLKDERRDIRRDSHAVYSEFLIKSHEARSTVQWKNNDRSQKEKENKFEQPEFACGETTTPTRWQRTARELKNERNK